MKYCLKHADYLYMQMPLLHVIYVSMLFAAITFSALYECDVQISIKKSFPNKVSLFCSNSLISIDLQEWNDYNLRWNDSDYGGVKDLRITPNKLWKPDVLMYNRYNIMFILLFKPIDEGEPSHCLHHATPLILYIVDNHLLSQYAKLKIVGILPRRSIFDFV